MNGEDNVIGAFSEEHASQLSGISVHQLRRWDRDFFSPSYGTDEPHVPYGRIYSFKDLVSLRVLNALRNDHGVSLQHLRAVSRKLEHLADDRWIATTLYVLGRRVVWNNPKLNRKQEIVAGQLVFDIPLKVAISNTHRAIENYNKRGAQELGHVVRARFVAENEPVLAGTRISVAAIKRYSEAGYTEEQILREYPDLKSEDVRAALVYQGHPAAA